MEKRSSRGPSSICVEKAINPECLPGWDIRVDSVGCRGFRRQMTALRHGHRRLGQTGRDPKPPTSPLHPRPGKVGFGAAPAKGRFAAVTAVRGPIPDVGRAPGRSAHGVEQRLCFLSLISGASPPNRCWPTLLPTSPERTSSSTAASSIYIHVLALGIASAAASCQRQRLSVRPYRARTCRTGPRRRCRNNLLDCGPSRSCTRHRGYSPRRQAPAAGPAP